MLKLLSYGNFAQSDGGFGTTVTCVVGKTSLGANELLSEACEWGVGSATEPTMKLSNVNSQSRITVLATTFS